jgi:hypothetical protein
MAFMVGGVVGQVNESREIRGDRTGIKLRVSRAGHYVTSWKWPDNRRREEVWEWFEEGDIYRLHLYELSLGDFYSFSVSPVEKGEKK